MRRGLAGGFAVAALALAAPAVASADTTYCVPSTAIQGCPGTGNAKATLTAALFAVNSTTGAHDTILLGAQSFVEAASGLVDNAGNRVDIVGAGQGQTIVQGTGSGTLTSLTINEPTSTVSKLTVLLPPTGSNQIGLSLSGTATSVTVGANAGVTGTGVSFGGTGAAFNSGAVTLPVASANTGVQGSGSGAVQDSVVSGGTGIAGAAAVVRDRVTGGRFGVFGPASGGAMTVEDTTIVTTGALVSETGLSIGGAGNGSSGTVRHVTVVGDGAAGSTGVFVQSRSFSGQPASTSVTVGSSIIRGFASSVSVTSNNVGSSGSSDASLAIDYSDFDASTESTSANSNATATITAGSHNVANLDPLFVNPGTGDYRLPITSPVRFNGNPMLGGGESTTDLNGKPRVVTYNGSSATGMGAFQHQPVAPTVSATANLTTAAIGMPITFSGSASDPNPGDMMSLSWSFDDGATASGATAVHAFSTPGRHTATLTARDLDNLTGAASASVTVVAAGPTAATTVAAGPTAPGVISNESIVPQSFPAAPSGGPVQVARAKRKYGTVISYLDSQPGITTFTVQRPTAGRLSGKSCVKPGKRKGKRCTLYLTVGSFTHADVAGANKFRFTGRVNGRKLKPGSYRLQAVTANTAGKGKPVFKTFHIIR